MPKTRRQKSAGNSIDPLGRWKLFNLRRHGAITPEGDAHCTDDAWDEVLGFVSYKRLKKKPNPGFWLSQYRKI